MSLFWGEGWRVVGEGEADGNIGFCHEHALILYVYLPSEDDETEESVLTVSLAG